MARERLSTECPDELSQSFERRITQFSTATHDGNARICHMSSEFDRSLLTWQLRHDGHPGRGCSRRVSGIGQLAPVAVPGDQFHGVPRIEGHLKTRGLAERTRTAAA